MVVFMATQRHGSSAVLRTVSLQLSVGTDSGVIGGAIFLQNCADSMFSTSSAKLIQTTRRNLVRACVSSASKEPAVLDPLAIGRIVLWQVERARNRLAEPFRILGKAAVGHLDGIAAGEFLKRWWQRGRSRHLRAADQKRNDVRLTLDGGGQLRPT